MYNLVEKTDRAKSNFETVNNWAGYLEWLGVNVESPEKAPGNKKEGN